ncbi:MAG: nicotinate (nicotinamide) nucleotide adenylyltransferase [Clostridia bacterium]|nr:nicotinate (nicotinamide) nucleotide adenylyltransferase [Clostridia bacterium]
MSRIGIFGGTFAPFHKGHEQALKSFLNLAEIDLCLVIPAGTPPHKTKTQMFTDRQRLEMTQRACDGIEGVTVSDFELQKESKSYTYQTLGWLKEQYPDDTLILYVGSDMLLTLQQWVRPEEIFALAEIAAFSRTGTDLTELKNHASALEKTFPGARITVYREPPFAVSSTEIREKWERGEDLSDLIPEGVNEYLTLLRYENFLRSHLSEHRLNHSLGVMKEAEALAEIHGADVKKARIAGLLHDMTKEYPKEEHFRLFEKYSVDLDENLKTNKNLWHAVSASVAITEVFGITDPEIASAIRFHTTGKATMSLLEAILYIADLTDETRDYDDVDFYRALARENVEKAVLIALRWCKNDVEERGLNVHKDMIDAIAWLTEKYPHITEETEKTRMKYPMKGSL